MVKKNIHGLFITHMPISHLYGATKSLRLYLETNQDFEISLIVPRYLNPLKWQKKVLDKDKEEFGDKLKKIHSFFLPIDLCYQGAPEGLASRITVLIKNLLFYVFKWQINRLCSREQYDFIYLNSVILNPLIDSKFKYFLHIREVILDCLSQKQIQRINCCAGIIFIDLKTSNFLANNNLSIPYTIINNPVDMRSLKRINLNNLNVLNEINISTKNNDLKIFSCIGEIIPVKGIHFIIKSFLDANLKNSILLIVGGSKQYKYFRDCQKLADKQNNIYFIGEVREIEEIYYCSDFIVRGDPDFRIGRTIFEGLYSGCGVIIPGTQEEIDKYKEFNNFRKKIYNYQPQNIHDLARILTICEKKNVLQRTYMSNANEYAKRLNEYILKYI